MKGLEIIPYIAVDGIMTMTDSQVMALYDRMVIDGRQDTVFVTGHISCREDFLRYMKSRGVLSFVLRLDKEDVGCVWLDNMYGRTAYCHFCTFASIQEKAAEVGRETLKRLLSTKKVSGGHAFDLLKGLCPAWNKRAIAFALKCGGEKLGIVPCAVWNAAKQESEDAAFIYYTRGQE